MVKSSYCKINLERMKSVVSVLSRTPNLLQELKKAVPSVSFVEISNPDQDEKFKESNVVVGDYDLLGPYLYSLPNLKWMQGTWAGVETLMRFIKPNQLPNYPITRFSGQFFGQLMSEYVIANIINYERDFFKIKHNQNAATWYRKEKIVKYRSLTEISVGILGLGSIGSQIGKKLHLLGAEIHGFGRRTNRSDYPDTEYISKYYSLNMLSSFLEECDYVINVLPSTPETTGLLNGDVLEICKKRQTVFINIGRGSIISEECLLNALNNNWIYGAILDVFETEPLNSQSALWSQPNVFITPHVSGMSRAQDVAQQFRQNYEMYLKNAPIPNLVDFTKGY